MRTIAITGSASGIGAATRKRLERDGARVVGVDLRGAEVQADLATRDGRAAAIAAVGAAAGGALEGVVACAGLGPQHADKAAIVSVNYFGAIEMLDGLRPLLARGERPAAIAICSNSATLSPAVNG